MVDYRELIKARKKLYRDLKPALQKAKKELNDLYREVLRVQNRKKAVPDEADLVRIAKMHNEIDNALVKSLTIIKKGYEL